MKKLLLDENLPKKLKYRFGPDYEVVTVPEMGWASLENGQLLKAMQEAGFEYLVTADKNLSFQQNYDKYGVRLLVLNTKDNRYETVLPFVGKLKELLEKDEIPGYVLISL